MSAEKPAEASKHARNEDQRRAPPPWRRWLPQWLRRLIWSDDEPRYDAFLSYSWAGDGMIAPLIHSAIEGFLRTWYGARTIKVFRDLEYLPATSTLEEEIHKRLDRSTHLIVLASLAAPTSRGMELEAKYWFSGSRTGDVLVLVTEGDADKWPEIRHTLLPPTLRDHLMGEPVFVKLGARREALLKGPHDQKQKGELVEDLRQLFLRLYSPRDWSELRGEERARRRIAISVLSGFVLLLTGLTGWAIWQTSEAIHQAIEVRKNAAAALFASIRPRLDRNRDWRQALLTACQAIETAPENDPRLAVYIARAIYLAGEVPQAALHLPATLYRKDWPATGKRDVTSELNESWDTIATVSPDQKLGLWDVATGRPVNIPRALGEKSYGVSLAARVDFSPDGRWIAVPLWINSRDESHMEIWTWELRSAKLRSIIRLEKYATPLTEIKFAGDSKTIIALMDSLGYRKISAWDSETGVVRPDLDLSGSWPVWSGIVVTRDPTANWLFLNREPGKLTLVNLTDASKTFSVEAKRFGGASVARFSADGKHLFALVGPQLIHIDTSRRVSERLALPDADRIGDVSPDGLRVLITGSVISMFETSPLRPVDTAQRKAYPQLHQAVFGKSSNEVVMISTDNEVHSWSTGDSPGEEIRSLPGEAAGVSNLRISADRKRLAAVQADGTVWIWDLNRRLEPRSNGTVKVSGTNFGVRFSGDDYDSEWASYLLPGRACCNEDFQLQKLQPETGLPLWESPVTVAVGPSIAESRTSNLVAATVSRLHSDVSKRGVALIRADNGHVEGFAPARGTMCFRANGSLISVSNSVLSEFDVSSSQSAKVAKRTNEVPGDFFGFAGSGEYLVCNPRKRDSDVREILLRRSSDTGEATAVFRFWNPGHVRLAISALLQSDRIAVESRSKVKIFFRGRPVFELEAAPEGARMRSVETGTLVARPPDPPFGGFVLSPDGRLFATPHGSTVRIWETVSGEPVTEEYRFGHDIAGARFDTVSRRLRLATRDGKLWDIPVWFGEDRQWARMGEALTGWRAVSPTQLERIDQAEFSQAQHMFLARLQSWRCKPGALFLSTFLNK